MTGGEDRLLALLDVEGRILGAATRQEVTFVAVNEARHLAQFRQAALWTERQGVVAVSGLALPDKNSPFMLWQAQVFRALAASQAGTAEIGAADLPPALAEQWDEWLPTHGLFLPWAGAALLFVRDEPWETAERALLTRLAEVTRVALRGFERPSLLDHLRPVGLFGTRRYAGASAAAVLVALFPVTGSVLAPAEMVPAGPAVVRAPMDGAVDRIEVQPNDTVAEGQPLFRLDATQLAGKLDVVRQEYASAEAEYRQVAQAQVFDPKAKAQVALSKGKMEERQAEVRWLESQLDRIHVKAPRAGIAVFDDPSEWVGRPVTVGERVMLVAAETDTEVEAWLPVADAGQAHPGEKVTLFLNAQPLTPVHAVVRSVAYEASARPDGTLAHRVRATLADADHPRLGLKGTARIDGDSVPLVWWLFRRPLAAVRQTLGM